MQKYTKYGSHLVKLYTLATFHLRRYEWTVKTAKLTCKNYWKRWTLEMEFLFHGLTVDSIGIVVKAIKGNLWAFLMWKN